MFLSAKKYFKFVFVNFVNLFSLHQEIHSSTNLGKISFSFLRICSKKYLSTLFSTFSNFIFKLGSKIQRFLIPFSNQNCLWASLRYPMISLRSPLYSFLWNLSSHLLTLPQTSLKHLLRPLLSPHLHPSSILLPLVLLLPFLRVL